MSWIVLGGWVLLLTVGSPAAPNPTPEASLEEAQRLISLGQYTEAAAACRKLLEERRQAGAEDSLEAANIIDLLVGAMGRAGKGGTEETRDLAERAVRIKETALGRDHPDLARSLYNLARIHQEARDFAQAKSLMERSVEVAEKAGRSDHPLTIRSLIGLGMLHYFAKELDEAGAYLAPALERAQRALGPEHSLVAESLNSLALVHALKSEYSEAQRLFEQALAIREKLYGPDHPEVAASLSNLSTTLMEIGNYEEAKRMDTRVLEIRERTLGPDNPLVARSLDNLSVLLMELGELDTAKRYSERAAKIHAAHLGSTHPDVAISLSTLASIMWRLGRHAEGRDLLEWCLKILQDSPSVHRAAVAVNLNELGRLQFLMGNVDASRRAFQSALDIWIEILGPEHPEVGVALHNLVPSLKEAGDYVAARQNVERALEIWQKAYGPEHQYTGLAQYSLAQIFQESGDLDEAAERYARGLAVLENVFDPEHPKTAELLNDLGTLLALKNDLEAAERRFAQSLRIREKVLGPEHPDVALSLNSLAALHWQNGRFEQAFEEALRAEEIVRRQVQHAARGLSDREALQYEQVQSRGLDVALTILTDPPSDAYRASGLIERAWDASLRSRALVLSEMARRSRTLAGETHEGVAELASALDAARGRLAQMLVAASDTHDPESYRERLAELVEDTERTERALTRKSLAFRREIEERQVGLDAVKSALPADSALLAMVRYNHLSRPAAGSTTPSSWPAEQPRYLAFVLKSGGHAPVLVPLGPAKDLDGAVDEWRQEVGRQPGDLLLGQAAGEEKYRSIAARLRKLAWDPIAEHLGGARRVLLAPDGVLHLVSFATLPDSEGRYLVESGPRIHYLSSERELVRPAGDRSTGRGLLVLGGVDFDAAPVKQPVLAQRIDPPDTAAAVELPLRPLHRRAACDEFQALRFRPLPSTRLEVDQIASLWQSRQPQEVPPAHRLLKLTGAGAREGSVKSEAAGRRILHFATHSFLPSERCSKGSTVDLVESPLLRAGLVLAGANHRGQAEGGEDGILTAAEIAGLDLTGVEWVVLSACETGLGKVQTGEGVLGLRRAFEIAGADTLIMSLWAVEDQAAQKWMGELYEARLEGLSTEQALHRASLSAIRERRKEGRSTHPVYWGAFVAAGDWR